MVEGHQNPPTKEEGSPPEVPEDEAHPRRSREDEVSKTTRVSSSSGHHSLEEAITIAIATIITDNTIKEGGGHRAARDDDVGVGDNNKCCGKEDKEDGVKISLRDSVVSSRGRVVSSCRVVAS